MPILDKMRIDGRVSFLSVSFAFCENRQDFCDPKEYVFQVCRTLPKDRTLNRSSRIPDDIPAPAFDPRCAQVLEEETPRGVKQTRSPEIPSAAVFAPFGTEESVGRITNVYVGSVPFMLQRPLDSLHRAPAM